MKAAVFLIMLATVALCTYAISAEEVYSVDILLNMSSDWTDVTFSGGIVIVRSYEVTTGSTAPGLDIRGLGALSVGKRSLDPTSVVVRFHAYVTDLAASALRITIAKGHIGASTVSLWTTESAGAKLVATYTHKGVANTKDPSNPRTFPLGTARIEKLIEPEEIRLPSDTSFGGKKVLAFYYPWYGNPEGPSKRWVHWNPYTLNHNATHTPTADYYDSQDPATVRRHINEARAAGIDGFIVSWWGKGTFEDRSFQVILNVAEQEGFPVTVYYEDAQSTAQIVSDVSYILLRYASSPSFLTVDGAPVIFFYGRVTDKFSPQDWKSVFDALHLQGRKLFAIGDGLRSDLMPVFQGTHTYNPVWLAIEDAAQQYKAASLLVRIQGVLFAATVTPGFEEGFKGASDLLVDRLGGETYRSFWRVARASQPQWILITSFNEWHEGSEIEPSVEFGTSYLELTAEEAHEWKTGEPVDDRDEDGVPDAKDYCPDYPGKPETNGC